MSVHHHFELKGWDKSCYKVLDNFSNFRIRWLHVENQMIQNSKHIPNWLEESLGSRVAILGGNVSGIGRALIERLDGQAKIYDENSVGSWENFGGRCPTF